MEHKKSIPNYQNRLAAALLFIGSFSLPFDTPSAFNSKVNFNEVPSNLTWPPNSEVGFRINIANVEQDEPSDGTPEDFRNAIVNSAAKWNDVDGVNFKFVDEGDTTSNVAAYNGVNEIIFQHRPDTDRAGITVAYFKDGHVIEVDTVINNKFDFDMTDSPTSTEIDLETVMLHEFGHWLILSHSENPDAVMYSKLKPGTVKRELHREDKSRMQQLYKSSLAESPEKIERNAITTLYRRQKQEFRKSSKKHY